MNILAIGAHPDDIEILCGGTLALLSKRNNDVFICHVCDGSKGSNIYSSEELIKIRRNEAMESAKLIGAISICAGVADCELVFEAIYCANLKLLKTSYPPSDKLPYLYYMDTLAGINFVPQEYVDITHTIEIKVEMMMKMKSQLGWLKDMHNCDAEDFINSVAKFRGFQAGVLYAEAFTQQQMYPQGLTKRVLP